ncbi:hypothetical protein AMAG_01819 [Allomyces macrogynus ATCC 38327]|uniref:Uncharacterized protein n=1 Tax=Allomyces macrogynus (strain ATCC 38327) TaxID=578462 RepID=A0A0L0S033_ALLM3|nr:hypothetical protein AMAG_01819 [Allomyces macrogynus ATCC 38327]|eukprot:KNE55972.1 hypothetical protein AMAG_01819 [Allomyces macrogynus ATCC 38327]
METEVEPVVDVTMEEVCEAPLEQQQESPRRNPRSPCRNPSLPVDARELRLHAAPTTIKSPKPVDSTKAAGSPKSVDAPKAVASPKPLESPKSAAALTSSRPIELSKPLEKSIPDLMDVDDAEAVAAEMLLGLAKQARLSQSDLPAVRAPPPADASTHSAELTKGLPPITSPVTSPSRQAPAPVDPATATTDSTAGAPTTPAKPPKRRRIVRGTSAESTLTTRVLPGPVALVAPVPAPRSPAAEAVPHSASPIAPTAPVETAPPPAPTDASAAAPDTASPPARRQAAARVQSYASLHAGVYDEGIFEARLPSGASPPPAAKRTRKASSCFGPPLSTPRARKKSADADGGDASTGRARKKSAAEAAPPGMPMKVVTVEPTPRKQPGRPRIRVVPGAPPPPPLPAGVVVVGSVDTSASAAAPTTAGVDPVKEEVSPLTSTVEEEVKVENV